MTDQDPVVESLLKDQPAAPRMSDEDKSAMLQSVQEQENGTAAITASSSSKTIIFGLLALAAVALLVVGWQENWWQGAASSTNDNQELALVSAESAYYVLQAQEDEQDLITQSFHQFDISHVSVGERLGSGTLAHVSLDSYIITHPDDGDKIFNIIAANAAAVQLLQAETNSLAALFETNSATNEHLDRLMCIAEFGQMEAITLLHTIAKTDEELAMQIGDLRNPVSQIESLLTWTQQGSQQSRIMAVRDLSSITSPLAIGALQQVALGDDHALAMLALDAIIQKKTNVTALALATISTKTNTDDVSRRAAKALASLVQQQ